MAEFEIHDEGGAEIAVAPSLLRNLDAGLAALTLTAVSHLCLSSALNKTI